MPIRDFREESEIRKWVREEPEGRSLSIEETAHVVTCLRDIVLWYGGGLPDYDLDPFMIAVVKNDFMRACGEADDINRKILPLYAKFLFNNLPGDWREKGSRIR